ncbi:MAG: hypothetical protein ACK4GT_22010, partial [Pararhodobacter sp.]
MQAFVQARNLLARREADPGGEAPAPFEKISIGGAKVVVAAAVTAPTPKIVVSRRALSSVVTRNLRFLAQDLSFVSTKPAADQRHRDCL